jgi:hypothetical protein
MLMQTPDIFEGVESGERVEITLKNKYAFTGWCIEISTDRKIITLDVSHDYPDVKGTISFSRHNIVRIKELRQLNGVAREEMIKQINESRDRLAAAEKKRKQRDEDASRKREEDLASAAEDDKKKEDEAKAKEKAVNFFNKFPEAAGWGAEKFEAVKNSIQPTPEEQLFYNNYELWLEGKKSSSGQ